MNTSTVTVYGEDIDLSVPAHVPPMIYDRNEKVSTGLLANALYTELVRNGLLEPTTFKDNKVLSGIAEGLYCFQLETTSDKVIVIRVPIQGAGLNVPACIMAVNEEGPGLTLNPDNHNYTKGLLDLVYDEFQLYLSTLVLFRKEGKLIA